MIKLNEHDEVKKPIPHKHAALIKAWADGAEIQFLSEMGQWRAAPTPFWNSQANYRIKPVPKPDWTETRYLTYSPVNGVIVSAHKGVGVILVFDGETNNLKAVSLL